jgi:hypothetical protein
VKSFPQFATGHAIYPDRSFFANKRTQHLLLYFTSRKISGFSRGAIQGKP